MPIETGNGTRLTKSEAAAFLGLSVRQLQRLMGSGEIAYQRARGPRGDVLLFNQDELNRFAAARRAQLYVPKIYDTPFSDTAADDVHPAPRENSLVPAGSTALQSSDFVRQLGEAIAKAGAEMVEQLRKSKPDPSLLELATKVWLTRKEAVKLSGLPVQIVYQGLRSGRLGAKHGRRWVVRRDELQKFAMQWSPRRAQRR